MTYSTPFLLAWKEYLHWKVRSSKIKSYEVWRRRGLDDQADTVIQWIHADDSVAGDKFTPGMQVWLKKHDFNEPPPQATPDRGEGFDSFGVWVTPRMMDEARSSVWAAVSELVPLEQRDSYTARGLAKLITDVAAGRQDARTGIKAMQDG